MKRGWQILLTVSLALMAMIWSLPTARAAKTTANNVGYSVRPILPANQMSKRISYFDLRAKPGQTQRLQVVVDNTSNRSQKFRVSVNQAVTNDNGVIDYSQLKPQRDSSLKVGITDIFGKHATQTITIPANAQKRVTVSYTLPAKKFRGIILGGVYVAQLQPKSAQSTSKIMIRNMFAYAIGVSIQEGATVKPDLKLNQVTATQINARNFVAANLQNFQPGLLQHLTVNARVTQVGNDQTVISQKQAQMGMAPNSNFDFGIPWGNQQLKAGTYTLYLTAKSGDQQWRFVRNFTINAPTIKRLNRHALTPTRPNYLLYLALLLLIAILLAIIGYLIYRNRHPQDDSK
ncbi:DUF916 and DUF3324 domain-containing protein [Levilactobacillus brevis]|nr:DUF916 and DUF3324 domain-containing protein [Levilactobacillus brevis]